MRNKKSWIILLSLPLLLGSCLTNFIESEVEKSIKANETDISAYLTRTGEKYDKDLRGVYYRVDKENPGGRELADQYDLALNYTLTTLDGTLIDKKESKDSARFNFYLSQSFEGFIYSLLHLREGEKGTFLIPGYLAYGKNPPAGVLDWAVVKAEIEITRFVSEEDKIDEYVFKKQLVVNEKTSTGLRIIRQNAENTTAVAIKDGDNVKVKYTGMYLTEKSFDSGELTITLGSTNLIAGFIEGVKKLKNKEKARLVFPSSLGYGNTGYNTIPPYTPLIFDIEILTVNGE